MSKQEIDNQEHQNGFDFADDIDALLENLPLNPSDEQKAMAGYQEHLWALVKIVERALNKEGIKGEQAYKLGCVIIAQIAFYQGGKCRYLPRGDKLKQELRNIQIFKLWHDHGWTTKRINESFCPELNEIHVHKIIRTMREQRRRELQPTLF